MRALVNESALSTTHLFMHFSCKRIHMLPLLTYEHDFRNNNLSTERSVSSRIIKCGEREREATRRNRITASVKGDIFGDKLGWVHSTLKRSIKNIK